MRQLESHYRFLRPLAAGGEGEVFLAEDLLRAGLPVALKVMPTTRGAPAEFQQLARLRHRSLARVLDAGRLTDPPRSYLTTEFFPGRPLTALPAPLSWELLGSILRETCAALAALNDAGLRHGDLKPAHILYEEQSDGLRVRLIDLGHARPLVDPNPPRAGTAPYAAPELWSGEPAGPSTDLYALGMCCMELLAGRLPLSGGSLRQWRQWHRTADRTALLDELPVHPPAVLRELLRECIQPDPADRPRDAGAMRNRLPGTVPILDIDAPAPRLVGRDETVDELCEWALRAPEDELHVTLVAGPRGMGKSRLLEAVARRARVEDRPVHEVRTLAEVGPAEGLWIADDVDPAALADWPGESLTDAGQARIILALQSKAKPVLATVLRRLRRRVPQSRLIVVGPVDPTATRMLLEDIRSTEVGVSDAETAWRRSGGVPAQLLTGGAPARGARRNRSQRVAQLTALSRLLPAAAPVSAVRTALDCSPSELWRALVGAGDCAPLAAGVFPDLVLHPGPRETADEIVAEEDRSLLERLAAAWEHTPGPHADWAPSCLRLRAGSDVSESALEARCSALADAGRWQELVALATAAQSRFPVLGRCYLIRGWSGEGRIHEAIEQLERWSIQPGLLPPETALEVARLHARAGQPRRAHGFFLRALADARDAETRLETLIETIQGSLAAGLREEALRLRSQLDLDALMNGGRLQGIPASGAARLGGMLVQMGERATGRRFFEAALAQSRKQGLAELGTTLTCLSGLAGEDRIDGELDRAEHRFRSGLRYARMSGLADRHSGPVQLLQFNLAALLLWRGDTDGARRWYRRLDREVRRTGNLKLLPHALVGLGTLHRDRGELHLALLFHLRAASVARETGNARAAANVLRNLGTLYLILGDPRTAYQCRLKSLRMAARTGDRDHIHFCRALLGITLARRGRIEEARRVLDRVAPAIAARPLLATRMHNCRAEMAWFQGNHREALSSWAAGCRDALRSGSTAYACEALCGMARVLAQRGDRDRARRLVERALRWARRAPVPLLLRVPAEVDRLRIERADHGLTEKIVKDAHELFHAARAHGLREVAVAACTLLCEERAGRLIPLAPLPAGSRHYVHCVLRRYQGSDRAAVAVRLGVRELEPRPFAEHTGPPVEVSSMSIEEALDHLRAITHASHCELSVTLDEERIRLSRTGVHDDVSGNCEVRSHSLESWPGGPVLELRYWAPPGGPGPASEALAAVRAAAVPDVARRVIGVHEERERQLGLELDRLRERSLADRERMETELLSQRLEARHRGTAGSTGELGEGPAWVARCPTLRTLMRGLERWAQSDIQVFIHGESGTGKDRLARLIHERSGRADGPFHIENFSAVPESLLEAELFGYRRGAFTGAERDREGSLDRVAGGTLVLDHVDELPESIQVRLLRVLEDGVFRPLGASEERRVDLRLIATSTRSPRELLSEGRLREDFYYRLQGVEAHLPPLRDRPEEIAPLIEAFFRWHARRLGVPVPGVDASAIARLEKEAWPGNVRELGNRVLRWLLLGLRRVSVADLDPVDAVASEAPSGSVAALPEPGTAWREANSVFQRRHLTNSLELHGWNRSRTARALGISRRQLHNLLVKLEIRAPGASTGG